MADRSSEGKSVTDMDKMKLENFPFEDAVQFGTASWIKEARDKSWQRFSKIGFPTTKSEFWRHTSLDSLMKHYFCWGRVERPSVDVLDHLRSLDFDVEHSDVIVFVNGFLVRKLSKIGDLPDKTVMKTILEADDASIGSAFGKVLHEENRPFAALNTAYFTDGLFLKVPEGKILPRPIHIVYVTTDGTHKCQTHVRNLLLLDRDSSANVIEHYLGENIQSYFVGAVTEAVLSRGSSLTHTKIQQETDLAYHFGTLSVRQEEGSKLTSRLFALGGTLGRSEVETCLAGHNAECLLEGLTVAKDHRHMDIRTFVDHAVPGCKSEQVFKSVLDHEAVSIFDGRVLVRENAQKTDAKQSNKNLLLSKKALVYSKPQLQIYADDVKCSHGSATGQLDEEAVFYLRSRGIGKEEARKTLVYAFAGEMVQRVGENGLKAPVHKLVNQAMGWEGEAL